MYTATSTLGGPEWVLVGKPGPCGNQRLLGWSWPDSWSTLPEASSGMCVPVCPHGLGPLGGGHGKGQVGERQPPAHGQAGGGRECSLPGDEVPGSGFEAPAKLVLFTPSFILTRSFNWTSLACNSWIDRLRCSSSCD